MRQKPLLSRFIVTTLYIEWAGLLLQYNITKNAFPEGSKLALFVVSLPPSIPKILEQKERKQII